MSVDLSMPILVVDDYNTMVRIIRNLLRQVGFTNVDDASDGIGALRRLREKLDETQRVKLRDMQRAWIASRDRSCGFYWDFYQGTMASPMAAECVNRETARRALFLLGFLNDDK